MSDTSFPETFDQALKILASRKADSKDALAERRRIVTLLVAFRNAYVVPCEDCGDSHAPEVITKPILILLSVALGVDLNGVQTDDEAIERLHHAIEELDPDDDDSGIAYSIFRTSVNAARNLDMQNLAARAATQHVHSHPNIEKLMN